MDDSVASCGEDGLLRDDCSALLMELFAELAEPLLVVNCDRRVVFRSRALDALIDRCGSTAAGHCEAVLLPAATTEGSCCLSAIDAYLPKHTAGLWHLKQGTASPLPVLAELRPVRFGSRLSLLALRFAPVPLVPSPVALSFFTGLRRLATDEAGYRATAMTYLRRMCGFGAAAWFDSAGGGPPRLSRQEGLSVIESERLRQALESTSASDTQDVLVQTRCGIEVFHSLTCRRPGGSSSLVVGRLDRQLDLQAIDAVRAAVCAVDAAIANATRMDCGAAYDLALFKALSPAEREVLRQICRGMADKEIARARGVSVYTVKNQVKRILEKTGAHRRGELISRFTSHC